MGRVVRQAPHAYAGPDLRRLVTHHVNPLEQLAPGCGVADVQDVRAGRGVVGAAGLLQHHIYADDIVAGLFQCGTDRGSEKAS
jgi:hypothetical protein